MSVLGRWKNMIIGSRHTQQGGDGSTNIQGDTVSVTYQQGLTYTETRQLLVDMFNDNFYRFKEEALREVQHRSEEFVDAYLTNLKARNPEAIAYVRDPNMQYSIISAQTAHARIGDPDLMQILVDVLVDCTSQGERTLIQIVLSEALSVIPKLTAPQLDILSVIFLIKYASVTNAGDFDSFTASLRQILSPFIPLLQTDNSLFQHLEYCVCGTKTMMETQLANQFAFTYSFLFCKGFPQDAFRSHCEPRNLLPSLDEAVRLLLIPSTHDSSLWRLAVPDSELLSFMKTHNMDTTHHDALLSFQRNYLLPIDQVTNQLISLDVGMNLLLDKWEQSHIKNMTLTTVGIAIAHANIHRRAKINMDLAIWIQG